MRSTLRLSVAIDCTAETTDAAAMERLRTEHAEAMNAATTEHAAVLKVMTEEMEANKSSLSIEFASKIEMLEKVNAEAVTKHAAARAAAMQQARADAVEAAGAGATEIAAYKERRQCLGVVFFWCCVVQAGFS